MGVWECRGTKFPLFPSTLEDLGMSIKTAQNKQSQQKGVTVSFFELFPGIPEHKTNILPLRWFANACNHMSSYPLHKAIEHEDFADQHSLPISKACYRWWKLYRIIDAPYRRWGTTYRVDWHK